MWKINKFNHVQVYVQGSRDAYIHRTHSLELKRSDAICCELLGVGECNAHHSVTLCTPGWPILITFYPRSFLKPCQHHNG